MNDQTPADPFDVETSTEADNRHNPEGLAALRREVMAGTLETGGIGPERWTRTAQWSELDQLSLTRACVWITHADGYGVGITNAEATILSSRSPEAIPRIARRIVRRLSEVITTPEADGQVVSRSDALHGIIIPAE
ncbi:hypothetical protein [Celeribacter sp.]|uniref:hypothetical protein n=1 Tax=Celeribacter sp. TaxID=1890673 RepID=UPI003A91AF0B